MSNVTVQDWNHKTRRLEDITGKDFVSSESVVLLASQRSIYDQATIDTSVAVGITQDIQLQQRRQSIQLNEIGSRRKYTFSSGRTEGSLSISRALFDGHSLLKAVTRDEIVEESGSEGLLVKPADEVADLAGYGDFYMNLGSTLFSKPIGLTMVFRDIGGQNTGAIFFQEAYIVGHGLSVSSNQSFIGENISIVFEGIYPVQHRSGARPSKTIVQQ